MYLEMRFGVQDFFCFTYVLNGYIAAYIGLARFVMNL